MSIGTDVRATYILTDTGTITVSGESGQQALYVQSPLSEWDALPEVMTAKWIMLSLAY